MARTTKNLLISNKEKKSFFGLKVSLCGILGLVIGFLIVFFLLEFYNPEAIVFDLKGESEIEVMVGTEYIDEGFEASIYKQDVTNNVLIEYMNSDLNYISNIDYNTIGVYYISYTIEKDTIKSRILRKVNVVPEPYVSDISIHFIETGNKYSGDCIYIKAGDTDILIDGGSKKESASHITEYLSNYVTDGILEYVIVSNMQSVSGFVGNELNPGIFDIYRCGTIIDFPKAASVTIDYELYLEKRDLQVTQKGAKRLTALDCYKEKKSGAKRRLEVAEGVFINFLYNYYYEYEFDPINGTEGDYSVCFMLEQANRNFLFTSNLSTLGEENLLKYNVIGEVDVLKAGNYGATTSTSEALLNVCNPSIVVIPCVAGDNDSTTVGTMKYPSQKMLDRVALYTDKIYVPSYRSSEASGYSLLNGNIVITSIKGDDITVTCSNNDILFKDSIWFTTNRTWNTKAN